MASLVLFHTRSRDEANDPEFCRPLADATGVWIGGGKQTALTSAYLGTEVERQLKAVLDRGGVIGGTSAGAAVMTRVMIASGRTEAVLSRGFDLLPARSSISISSSATAPGGCSAWSPPTAT